MKHYALSEKKTLSDGKQGTYYLHQEGDALGHNYLLVHLSVHMEPQIVFEQISLNLLLPWFQGEMSSF